MPTPASRLHTNPPPLPPQEKQNLDKAVEDKFVDEPPVWHKPGAVRDFSSN